jgi:RNA polymerase sigma factor (sigma-70 family)
LARQVTNNSDRVSAESDHQRLERLLRDYGARLRSLIQAHRLERHGIDSADVEQEVRIRLWKALERDRNSPPNASYIQKVVATAVIDAVRRAHVRVAEPLPEDDEPNALLVEAPSPERQAGQGQTVSVVARCLTELPGQRGAVVGLHMQGFSLDEIAGLTGVSSEAVRKLVSRGIEQVKARLAELGYGEFDD